MGYRYTVWKPGVGRIQPETEQSVTPEAVPFEAYIPNEAEQIAEEQEELLLEQETLPERETERQDISEPDSVQEDREAAELAMDDTSENSIEASEESSGQEEKLAEMNVNDDESEELSEQ